MKKAAKKIENARFFLQLDLRIGGLILKETEKELKVLELFGGIGAFTTSLKRLNIPHEVVDYVEIDKYAVKSYNAIHNTNFEPQDICTWDKDIDVDFIMHGSPCFTKKTSVLTKDGYKYIVDLKKGDHVLDHTNQYHEVSRLIPQGKKEIWELEVPFADTIETTENHRFFVRKPLIRWNEKGEAVNQGFGAPEWIPCNQLRSGYRIGYAINQEEREFQWKGCRIRKGHDTVVLNGLDTKNPMLWYVAGMYLGCGQLITEKHENRLLLKGFQLHIPKRQKLVLKRSLRNYLLYTTQEEDQVFCLQSDHKELAVFLSMFGQESTSHRIPGFVYRLPIPQIQAFLQGYWAICGETVHNLHQCITFNEQLAYGIGQCIAKTTRNPFSIHKSYQHPLWYVTFQTGVAHKTSFYENGYLWFLIKDVHKTKRDDDVYDITVEQTHSFTANGAIAHNCQDFSVAGRQQGGDKDSGTRSSLMYETVRIVEKLRPRYVLWENVRNMLSDRHRHNFDAYWEAMESFGYHNASYILNSKDYGVPQNRVRVFTLSVLEEDWKPEYFLPPQPQKLDKVLADVLDTQVDEKYYLSDKLLKSLLKNKENQQVPALDSLESLCLGNTNPSGRGINGNVYYGNVCPTLTTNKGEGLKVCVEEPKVHQVGNLFQYKRENPSAGRIYDQSGLSPTLTNMQGGHRQPYIVQRSHGYNRGIILSLAPSLTSSYYQENNFAILPLIAAMRGRYIDQKIDRSIGQNPENPLKRVAGDPTEQRLELNAEGLCNTLTSVQKDNLVLESIRSCVPLLSLPTRMTSGKDIASCIRSTIYKQGSRNLIQNILSHRGYEGVLEPSLQFIGGIGEKDWAQDGKKLSRNYPQGQRVYDANGLACSQTAQGGGLGSYTGLYYSRYRIRKLTPKECWRLMGFQDEEFEKAQAVCSNTQLYKQAGNSIVVNVLVAILKEVFSYE